MKGEERPDKRLFLNEWRCARFQTIVVNGGGKLRDHRGTFKGPIVVIFSIFLSLFPSLQCSCLEQSIIPRKKTLQKTASLTLCFQPPAKMLGFSFPLKLILCWCFQRSEHLAGGVAANLGELPFVTSERADFHVFKHKLFQKMKWHRQTK